ncbi:hypothetical protein B0181_05615 [Moraxella caviae]|uniref:Uncharacterized protein n=1 Tax=Moraxella caviae TaxID=34060 RepID=A0A1T0A2C0_9GAMM|nr:hypothetical protein [Moraxella caviae]OOR89890.1 hypothetical protein B0181_05615 [Moraxella caviae]STZ14275.1 Uncharacterised protein [Moraxella caviae]VEW10730.1 Uncharacterised protein [Moraxella caviae]
MFKKLLCAACVLAVSATAANATAEVSEPVQTTDLTTNVDVANAASHAQWIQVTGNEVVNVHMSPQFIAKLSEDQQDKRVEALSVIEYTKNIETMSAGDSASLTYVYDCDARTAGVKHFIELSNSGVVRNIVNVADHEIKMQNVVPRSLDEARLNYACSQMGW